MYLPDARITDVSGMTSYACKRKVGLCMVVSYICSGGLHAPNFSQGTLCP